VAAYVYLKTDAYPPFSLDDDTSYPVRLHVEYPEQHIDCGGRQLEHSPVNLLSEEHRKEDDERQHAGQVRKHAGHDHVRDCKQPLHESCRGFDGTCAAALTRTS
jgi:hypothetical protein